jgi:SpoVK/Ycf46/Vps4 family AAA+-type ATPase
VLIDEIESLASSRHRASSLGEIQDTIRATNALLTGFDKVKSLPNLIILCTSNMIDTLDTAFLDRCCHHIIIEDPDVVARYHILRDAIQELIFVGIIRNLHDEQTVFAIPSYRDAQLELLSQPFKAGSVLMKFCNALDSPKNQQYHRRNSARFLSQLPELALAYRMISDSCTLDEALEHMARFLHDQVTFVKNPPEDPRIENQCGSSNSELKRKRI